MENFFALGAAEGGGMIHTSPNITELNMKMLYPSRKIIHSSIKIADYNTKMIESNPIFI